MCSPSFPQSAQHLNTGLCPQLLFTLGELTCDNQFIGVETECQRKGTLWVEQGVIQVGLSTLSFRAGQGSW